MPTYAYRCKSCSHAFEEFQSISEEWLVRCPACKKDTLVRDIGGGAGLHFKGSGFYLTDYKSTPSSDGEKKSEPKTDSKLETKSDTKSDTKPADSTPPKPSGDTPSKP